MRKSLTIPAFLVGAVFGGFAVNALPARAALPSAPAMADRVFEIRTYTTAPGSLPALHARFRDYTMRIFERNGMTNIGYWTPEDTAKKENTLVYLLAYPNREAARKSWASFRTDSEWVKVSAATAAAGLKVVKVESQYVTPTDFSPMK